MHMSIFWFVVLWLICICAEIRRILKLFIPEDLAMNVLLMDNFTLFLLIYGFTLFMLIYGSAMTQNFVMKVAR